MLIVCLFVVHVAFSSRDCVLDMSLASLIVALIFVVFSRFCNDLLVLRSDTGTLVLSALCHEIR